MKECTCVAGSDWEVVGVETGGTYGKSVGGRPVFTKPRKTGIELDPVATEPGGNCLEAERRDFSSSLCLKVRSREI